MEKLKMQSLDKVDVNVEKVGMLFPNCITERLSKSGELERVIDFDILKQELSKNIVEGREERYQFTWPDKRKAILKGNKAINKTLRPCREESVDFDNTQNLYIEGDNLDVLKLLQETYLEKVKIIYIDPPYNTGKDFIYPDNFSQSQTEYDENSGNYDDEGNRLVKNLDTNGRFHTDWLNMMYPRLKIARDLLKDDGVIFISIDDNEVHNLRKICDEIFGTGNFIDIFTWQKTTTPPNLSKKIKQSCEYILLYQKHECGELKGLCKNSKSSNGLMNQTNNVGILCFPENIVTTSLSDGIYKAGLYGTKSYDIYLLEDTEVKSGYFVDKVKLKGKFKWAQKYLDESIKEGVHLSILTKAFSPSYDKDEYDPEKPWNIINTLFGVGTNENASSDLKDLMGKEVFSYPKPTTLIKYLINFIAKNDDIIIDFFSGSATTADAIMQLNSEDCSNLKFIMVQLPENLNKNLKHATDKKVKEIINNGISLLNDLNRPHVLSELGKERIRLAGANIKADIDKKNKNLELGQEAKKCPDIGFRVLKVDSTNMKDIYRTPEELDIRDLDGYIDNIKEDRSPQDLIFQVMLNLGVELSSKILQETIANKTVFNVGNENYLMACFDKDITEEIITQIAKQKPYYFVMRDYSMENDSLAINFEQIFKTYSPETICKIL